MVAVWRRFSSDFFIGRERMSAGGLNRSPPLPPHPYHAYPHPSSACSTQTSYSLNSSWEQSQRTRGRTRGGKIKTKNSNHLRGAGGGGGGGAGGDEILRKASEEESSSSSPSKYAQQVGDLFVTLTHLLTPLSLLLPPPSPPSLLFLSPLVTTLHTTNGATTFTRFHS